MNELLICCQRLKEALTERVVEEYKGKLATPGCCGGGCFVVDDMDYCPWCGSEIETVE